MSSGGGGGSGNTTTTTELPSWAQPTAQQILTNGQTLSQQNIPSYTGQMVAGLNGTQTGAIGNASGASNNQQGVASNASNYSNALQGSTGPSISNPYTGNVTASDAAASYANPQNNPYLSAQMNATNQGITQAYNSSTAPQTLAQFRNGGAFGGSAQAQATSNNEYQLANSLGNADAAIGNNAYNTGAGVASQNAAQQNAVNLSNQAIGTNANNAFNQNQSSNYFNNINSILSGENAATSANTASGGLANNALTAGTTQQQNSQDALNAAYQQWYNQVNQPYAQQSILSSALSSALGSGAGTSISQYNSGSGSSLGSLLGLGTTAAGLYGSLSGSS